MGISAPNVTSLVVRANTHVTRDSSCSMAHMSVPTGASGRAIQQNAEVCGTYECAHWGEWQGDRTECRGMRYRIRLGFPE